MTRQETAAERTLYTIGHSTRTAEEFVELLKAHGIENIIDVRTIPASRRNPQFGKDALRATLRRAGVAYEHLKELGGLRHPRKDSLNVGWRNAGFRGFADYMETSEFARGLERLQEMAARRTTAITCAESVPWRCHRSLIADALTVADWRVLHIQSRKTAAPHTPTPFLKVRGGRLTYPKERRNRRASENISVL